jgi:glyoxylase I family protein
MENRNVRIEHIALNVADPEAMVKWYCENFDMKVRRKSGRAFFTADKSQNVILEIYNNPAASVPDYRSIHHLVFHVAFCSENIKEDRKRLIKAGATANGEISKEVNGDVIANLRDPWGLAVQLVKRFENMH